MLPVGQGIRVSEQQIDLNETENVLLEVYAASLDYALVARRAAVNRIELCSDLDFNGFTLSYWSDGNGPPALAFRYTLDLTQTWEFRLFRPANFRFTRKDIQNAKRAGMDGVGLGLPTRKCQVAVARNRELVELAHRHSESESHSTDYFYFGTKGWRVSKRIQCSPSNE